MSHHTWIDQRAYRAMEASFFIGSIYCSILAFVTFIMAFNGLMVVDDFSTVTLYYWPTVLMYSTLRKARRARHPEQTPHRWTELILVFWMLVGLVGLSITVTFRRDMFPLMKELGILYLVLLGILLGGKAVENIVAAVLSPKK